MISFSDNFCTETQAIHLKQLGLPQLASFYYFDHSILIHFNAAKFFDPEEKMIVDLPNPDDRKKFVRAFTASELMEALPAFVTIHYKLAMEKYLADKVVNGLTIYETGSTIAEALAAMLIKLITHNRYDFTAEDAAANLNSLTNKTT